MSDSEPGIITKTQICAQIAARTGQSKEDASAFYTALVEVVEEGLLRGDRVSLTRLGLLTVSAGKKRKMVRFEASETLRDALRSGKEELP